MVALERVFFGGGPEGDDVIPPTDPKDQYEKPTKPSQ